MGGQKATSRRVNRMSALPPPKADIGRQVMLAEEAKPLTYRNAMLQKKAADLIDHSGSLADQARSHPVQCL